jgi:hypothetical protein
MAASGRLGGTEAAAAAAAAPDVVDWTSFDPDARVVTGWDDGHVPELFVREPRRRGRSDGNSKNNDSDANGNGEEEPPGAPGIATNCTTLVWRPDTWHASCPARPPPSPLPSSPSPSPSSPSPAPPPPPWSLVQVVDGALPPALAERLYEYTAGRDDPTWGTYVPIRRLLPLVFPGAAGDEEGGPDHDDDDDDDDEERTRNGNKHQHYDHHKGSPVATGAGPLCGPSLSIAREDADAASELDLDLDGLATRACAGYLRRALRGPGGMLRERLALAEWSRNRREKKKTRAESGEAAAAAASGEDREDFGGGENSENGDGGGGDEDEDDGLRLPRSLLRHAHGVAVWALRSGPGSPVPYHVDYAEQVRYARNAVVLPLLAGTLHCTPPSRQAAWDEGGGALRVYGSLEHYERHGYKGRKVPLPGGGGEEEDEGLLGTVEYRFNRLVIMAGHLPHASTPVSFAGPSPDEGGGGAAAGRGRRVVVGFNVFGHDVGPDVQRAPEHSGAWRRQVKLLRWQHKLQLQQQQQEEERPRIGGDGANTLAVDSLSPGMRKLLVLAKRQRVQEEWRREYLEERLREALAEGEGGGEASSSAMLLSPSPPSYQESELVRRILSQCSNSSSSWPTEQDVRRFLRQRHHAGPQDPPEKGSQGASSP